MNLIDGKKIAEKIKENLRVEIELIQGRKPTLAVILIGDFAPSQTYVRAKKKACEKVGITSLVFELDRDISERDLLKKIDELNRDVAVDGILVQLPLPTHIDETKVISTIDPKKDIDGFHPINVGKMLLGLDGGFIPCTPLGIKVLLEESKIQVEGKHVVIVGRSNIVGKPLAALLMQKKEGCNATVTILHSKSENLNAITKTADILIAAIGKASFITADMVKNGACVIDVGINREKNSPLVGDVDFENVKKKAGYITPVPGGVGPMTIAMLLQNTLQSYRMR